ncbi:ATP-binding protein [Bacillus shivajii]|uniref:ATP-binding protein n=1 Tax=Bacillus shivajii TaxID=1983719 RepID=UPI001CF9BFD3|nr:ATP-binding protein [Bacillus shivajii]UCZ52969.1 ATP-binding protein [Bacillus shivajii]
MDIDALLLNFLFILLPIFLTYMVFSLKPDLHRHLKTTIITIFSSLSIIMCMNYSIQLVEGFYYDLRVLPFTLTLLYAGHRVGFFVLIITAVYRFSIGGDGFVVTVILFLALFAGTALLVKKFEQSSLKGRLFIPPFIIVLFQLAVVFNYKYIFQHDFHFTFGEWVTIFSINILGMLFVTYIIELLMKITKIQEELVKTEKLKVVSELAASVSHEIKNPLTVTRSIIQLVMNQKDKIPEEKQQYYFEVAIEELERANRMLTDYMTLSKPQVDRIEPIDLSQEVIKTIHLITPLAKMKGIYVKMSVEKSGIIQGDKAKLHQCLLNLMKNGIEAMEEGGTLQVETWSKQSDCNIKIKDNGTGMNEAELKRLGTPYYSTKDGGTGLGMVVVYSLVKIMEGSIDIQSRPSEGTNVVLSFPTIIRTR